MRDDPTSTSVAAIFVSVAILAVTVAGVLFFDLYTSFTGSGNEQLASEFDPSDYPAPAAGIAGKPSATRACEDIIYRTTKGGIKYVRQSGGGVLIGAEYQEKFGFYKIQYGLLAPVDSADVDRITKVKLEYALYNCDGPFTPSSVDF